MAINADVVRNWPFAPLTRRYSSSDMAAIARGFGAGVSPALSEFDAPFIADPVSAFPVNAVALTDSDFWQQDPATGIAWQKMVHAAESITLHKPLPASGEVTIHKHIAELADRGPERGALLVERQVLSAADGDPIATVDTSCVLLADGGFGGPPPAQSKSVRVPEDRAPDRVLELRTPAADDAMFRISGELAVAGQGDGAVMLRGLCCFGLAGRGALALACDNDPARLRRMDVRYAGPMYCDETMRLEFWQLAEGDAVFRLLAVERRALVLNHCRVQCH